MSPPRDAGTHIQLSPIRIKHFWKIGAIESLLHGNVVETTNVHESAATANALGGRMHYERTCTYNNIYGQTKNCHSDDLLRKWHMNRVCGKYWKLIAHHHEKFKTQ